MNDRTFAMTGTTKPRFVRVAGVWRVAMAANYELHRFESTMWCVTRNKAAGVWKHDERIVVEPSVFDAFREAISDPVAYWRRYS